MKTTETTITLSEMKKGDFFKLDEILYQIISDPTTGKPVRVKNTESKSVRRLTSKKEVNWVVMHSDYSDLSKKEKLTEIGIETEPAMETPKEEPKKDSEKKKTTSEPSSEPSKELTPEEKYLQKVKPSGFWSGKTWKEVMEKFAVEYLSQNMWLVYKPESDAYRVWKEDTPDKSKTPYEFQNHVFMVTDDSKEVEKALQELQDGYFYMYQTNPKTGKPVGDYIGKKAISYLIELIF